MPDWTVHQGDCREILATLPEKSVHCTICSPPYWGLRDYGLEPSVWGDSSHRRAMYFVGAIIISVSVLNMTPQTEGQMTFEELSNEGQIL